MTLRILSIVVVAFAIFAANAGAIAQTPAPGTGTADSNLALGDLSRELLCRTAETNVLRCSGISHPAQPGGLTGLSVSSLIGDVDAKKAAGGAFSLYFANNLASEKATARFIQGVTGSEALGAKIAPTLLRISKSTGGRMSLGLAALGTGAYAVYEYFAAPKPDTSLKPGTLGAETTLQYRLLGVVDQNGGLVEPSPAGKP